MPLPQAVRQKADRAAALSREHAASKGNGAGSGSGTPPPAAPDLEKIKADNATLTAENARLQAANRVLTGKYDAEVPRLSEELKALRDQIKKLEEGKTRTFEAGEVSSLTEDERNTMGKPLLDATLKIAREVFNQEVDGRIKPITDRVDMLQRQTDDAFTVTIEAIPDYEKQNNDPLFLAWLKEGVDPATGQIRNDLLQRAVAARQGLRCVEIFAAYREGREIGASAPAKASPDPGPGAGDTPPKLDEGGPGTATYTKADISQFYSEKRQGKWKGREAEARALETDMLAASTSGRVTG